MELSEEIVQGLSALKDSKRVSDASFAALVAVSCDIVARKKTEDDLKSSDALSNLKPSILKQLYGAVVGYILECAKRNTDPLEMTEFLQGPTVQLPPARVEIITAKYTEVKPAVRSGLAGNGYNLPHLVDVDWRLDYFVKADTIDRATKPLYLLRLKARTDNLAEYPNGHKTIEFTATLEQLQDMVNKLADATQSLNRLDLS